MLAMSEIPITIPVSHRVSLHLRLRGVSPPQPGVFLPQKSGGHTSERMARRLLCPCKSRRGTAVLAQQMKMARRWVVVCMLIRPLRRGKLCECHPNCPCIVQHGSARPLCRPAVAEIWCSRACRRRRRETSETRLCA